MGEHKLEIKSNGDLHVDDVLQTGAVSFSAARPSTEPSLYDGVKTSVKVGGDYNWSAEDITSRTAVTLEDRYDVWIGHGWIRMKLNEIIDPVNVSE